MTLWFVLALMTAAAIFAVLWPLGRNAGASRSGSDLAVYRDQIEEIRRDQAAGLIGEIEAAAAQVEVSRRLIAAADAEEAAPPPEATLAQRRRAVALAALFALPATALALYLAVGSPLVPGQPLASRTPGQQPSIAQMVAQVELHLAKNPNDGRGWEVVAPIYMRLGRFEDAVRARHHALEFSGETAERQAALGEALTAAAGGVVSAEALAAFKTAVALDADHVKARFFLGLAAEQDGRIDDAVAIWRAMLEGAPEDAAWVQFVRSELVRIAGGPGGAAGPTEDQIAAAKDMPPDQRMAMIKTMVERLAEQLAKDGSDIEGWLRLMRSYMVLGDREQALAAASQARRVFAGDAAKLKRIDEFVKGLGLDG